MYGNGDLLEFYVTIASWISLALILLAGDIETNPGPETEIQLEIHAGGYKMLQVDAFVDAGTFSGTISICAFYSLIFMILWVYSIMTL